MCIPIAIDNNNCARLFFYTIVKSLVLVFFLDLGPAMFS